MNKATILFSFFTAVFFTNCDPAISTETEMRSPLVIPLPASIETGSGTFRLDPQTTVRNLPGNEGLTGVSEYLAALLRPATGFPLPVETGDPEDHAINLQIDPAVTAAEGYVLSVTAERITIRASTAAGAFYGVQTLRQLLPAQLESNTPVTDVGWSVPIVEIVDQPRFSYRGMHLDVARHFFPVEFIYKFIDLLALHKMNRFHWHLTEDQGWRIEIKQYPRLQEIAAYRDETLIGHYNDQPHQFDGKKYGGYYTQEEIRQVIAYARNRHITIIPEIEMPGHAMAALAAYPELGCHEGPYKTGTKWGIFEDVFCPKEETFTFLENVLTEVIDLFEDSPYIHIGGDETPKTQWKNSAFCQQLIREQNLGDEYGLQSYFIQRIEKFVNSKGRNIIGWDEILEGGLAPNATVMSWQGTKGGIAAAKEGHDVIMTPTSHCYFDYYQSRSDDEPLAIGGFIPLEKVYGFEPVPEELAEEETKFILGTQGTLWTEYIPTPEKAEYMVFPRAIALAEVGWTDRELKDYDDFTSRLTHHFKRLDALDVNYANHILDITNSIRPAAKGLSLEMSTRHPTAVIRYTTDGSQVGHSSSQYQEPLNIEENTALQAAVFEKERKISRTNKLNFQIHKAAGKSIQLENPPAPAYSLGGKEALINGIRGSSERYGDGEWLGWSGENLIATIDLGKTQSLQNIKMRFFNGNGQWIYLPRQVAVFLSDDGSTFAEPIIEKTYSETMDKTKEVKISLAGKTARFLKIEVDRYGIIEEGLQGGGHEAWLFVDEIIVN